MTKIFTRASLRRIALSTILAVLGIGLTLGLLATLNLRPALATADISDFAAERWATADRQSAQASASATSSILDNDADLIIQGNQVDARLGLGGLDSAGDVNGDGYVDIIVASTGYDVPGNPYTDEGVAFLFFGSAAGVEATPAVTLTVEQDNANFGNMATGIGDVNGDGYADVAAGAPAYDAPIGNEGAVFVYYGSPSGISSTPSITLYGTISNTSLGRSVAGAGDVDSDGYDDLIITANGYDNGQQNEGAAFVYHGSASGISTTPAITVENNITETQMRIATGIGDVDGDGYDDVLIGSDLYNVDDGILYVHHGSPTGIGATPVITLQSVIASARFGYSLDGAGDVNGDGYADIVIGAPLYANSEYREGAIFVYHGSPSGISAAPVITVELDEASAWMGDSVAGIGDANGDGYADIIASARLYDVPGSSVGGAAFVYHGSAGGIDTSTAVTLTGNPSYNEFGDRVAGAGDVNGDGYGDVMVAHDYYSNGQFREGAAFIYHGGGTGLTTAGATILTGEGSNDYFGHDMTTLGDINGDGYTDVAVGAYSYNSSQGRVYVYHGTPAGISTTPALTLTGEGSGDYYGVAVSAAGDVNGDGYGDAIIGADRYGTWDNGRAYVYHGSASGLIATPVFSVAGSISDAYLGSAVADAGDINGDGYGDVILGAFGWNSNRGRIRVYYGGPGGLDDTSFFDEMGENVGDRFGYAVAGAGDVNGDGYADVAIGAWNYDSHRGKVYVYHGGQDGLSLLPSQTYTGETTSDSFGWSVAAAGDVNGDSFADLIVGAMQFGSETGRTYIYHGSSAGLPASAAVTLTGETDSHFGSSVSPAGDVNGDGYADVIIGARRYPNSSSYYGKVYVYQGSALGVAASPSFSVVGDSTINNMLGIHVSTAGDVNGDGFADIIIGARGYNSNQGRAFVYYGGGGGGRVALPQQTLSDTTPIAPWGLTDFDNSFVAYMNVTDPLGRDGAKLQVEICRQGIPFGDADCDTFTSPTWTDVPSSGVTLSETISGLYNNLLYRWRARALYDSLFHPYSPWRRLFAQGLEADLQTISSTLQLVGIAPPRNAVTAALTTTVAATYNSGIDPATVTSRTFAVRGMQSGLVTATHAVVDGTTIVVTPTHPFFQGELVYAVATTDTLDWSGAGLITPTQWQFNAGVVIDRCIDGFADIEAGLTGVALGSAVWGDYDNDGDLDILLTGNDGSTRRAKIYQNTAGTFSEVYAGSLSEVHHSSAAWGDYDNDGDLDILLTGYTGSSPLTRLYENTGSGFTDTGAGLTNVHYSSVAWGDYDNDGNLDILLTGWNGSNNVSKIYRNTGSGFSEVYAGSLTGVRYGSVAWGDYDNDGDLDILLTGNSGAWGSIVREATIYQNTGTGFAEVYAGSLRGVTVGSVAWGDYDNDGDLDILLTGNDSNLDPISRIYQNTGSGFSQVYAGSLTGMEASSAAWGDYDNDGDLDILLTGRVVSTLEPTSEIYQNTGSGFSEVYAGSLTDVARGSVAWGDYDNDGDLDILLSGQTSGGTRITRLYENRDCADLTIDKTVLAPPYPRAGDRITYTISFANSGRGIATGVTISDQITATIIDRSVISVGVTITDTGVLPGYVWQVAPLAYDTGGVITVSGVISPALLPGDLVNTATITAAVTDVDPGDNQSVVTTRVYGAVAGTEPTANSHTAASTTNVTATLSYELGVAGITSQTMAVHGGYHGRLEGAYSQGSIVFDPDSDLFPGELVETSVTTGVWPAGTPALPAVWQFRAETTSGLGQFTLSDAALGTRNLTFDVALGDLDNDGDLDVFSAIYHIFPGSAYRGNGVWLNDGAGNFTDSGQRLGTGKSQGVALGDLDGDGDLDAYVTNEGHNRVWINQGGAQGGTASNFVAGQSMGTLDYHDVSLGDIDGDGDLDALVAVQDTFASQVWLNDGSGTFSQGQDLSNGIVSRGVALGDLDSDGDLDAVFANSSAPQNVYLNDGTGVFAGHPISPTFGTDPSYEIALGDLDSDGDLDAFLVNQSVTIPDSIWLNDGTGGFSLHQELEADYSRGIALGDLDADGDLDGWVANFWVGLDGSGPSTVWLNNGSATFTKAQETETFDSRNVAMGDVDGDGDLDVVPQRLWLNENEADLTIDKSVAPLTVGPGQTITYTLVYTNNGPQVAGSATIIDQVPVTLTNLHYESSRSVTPSGAFSYTWEVGSLGVGEGGIITLTGVVSGGVTGVFSLTNEAFITSTLVLDGDLSNNTSNISNTVDAVPPTVLAFSPSDGATEVSISTPVVITFSKPIDTATLDYAVTPDPGGWVPIWDGAGQVIALTHTPFEYELAYTVTITAANDLAGNQLLGAPETWSFTTELETTEADLAIDKLVTPFTVGPGQTVTYTLVYTNNGPQVADSVTIIDQMPITLTNLHYESNRSVTPSGAFSYTWEVGSLGVGEGGIITLTGVVSGGVTGVFGLTNEAFITSTLVLDGDLSNNTSTISDTVDAVRPTILAFSPSDGAVGVSINDPVVITFSKAIDTFTLNYTVVPDPGGWAPAWDGAGAVVTLTHTAFAAETVYTVTITAADDLAGNQLIGTPETWSFTTETGTSYIYLPLVLRN